MVEIKYNGVNPFTGVSQTPLVTREDTVLRTGQTETPTDLDYFTTSTQRFTLNGQLKRLTCTGGFQEFYNLIKQLIINFADNFKRFEIIENSITIFSHDRAIVESITFDESSYYDLVPFTITILCYRDESDLAYGVSDFSETFEFQEEKVCLVTITRVLSAKGFNNAADGLANARNWISTRSAYTSFSSAFYEVIAPQLIRQNEAINRLTGEVSLTQTYLFDKANTSNHRSYILVYTTEIDTSTNGISVKISGEFKGDMTGDPAQYTRFGFGSVDFSILAQAEYANYYSGTLSSIPIEASIDENYTDNTVSFSFTYLNNATTDPYLIDSTTISRGSDGIDCINTRLTIRSDFGCPAERLRKTTLYYQSFNLLGYIDSRWARYGTGKTLGRIPRSKGSSFNTQNGDITLQVSYCSDNYEDCGCLESLKYSISLKVALPQYAEEATYQGLGCYAIQALNFHNRAEFSISGSCRQSKCCTVAAARSEVSSRANQIMAQYFLATDKVLQNSSVNFSDEGIINFNFTWSGEQEVILPSNILSSENILLEDGEDLLWEDEFFILVE